MKTHTILFLILLFVNSIMLAQDFQGIATYKSHRKVDLKIGDDKVNSEMQKQIQEQLKKQFQQEYTLKFNKYESVYKQNEKLDAPSLPSSGIKIRVSQGSDIMYKNIKENRYTNKTEIYGKLFLVKDTLSNKSWELVSETKNIGEYTCYKATFNDEYETQSTNDKGEIEIITKQRTTVAWYTPQIPVNNGPTGYYGLPGLILEINDGKLTLICSKIVLNPKESFKIIEPNKGKEVTQKVFDELKDKKSKEMMEQFQSRRGSGDGERVMIRIGG